MQEVFLSGRDNRVDKQRKTDFTGTLRERREKYQDRREAQGQETDRLLKRMRAEEGLDQPSAEAAEESPVRSECFAQSLETYPSQFVCQPLTSL